MWFCTGAISAVNSTLLKFFSVLLLFLVAFNGKKRKISAKSGRMGRRRRNSVSDSGSAKTGSSDGSRQIQQSFLDERREPLQAVVCVTRSPLAYAPFGALSLECASTVEHALTMCEHE